MSEGLIYLSEAGLTYARIPVWMQNYFDVAVSRVLYPY
jgi:hypothetical protein